METYPNFDKLLEQTQEKSKTYLTDYADGTVRGQAEAQIRHCKKEDPVSCKLF